MKTDHIILVGIIVAIVPQHTFACCTSQDEVVAISDQSLSRTISFDRMKTDDLIESLQTKQNEHSIALLNAAYNRKQHLIYLLSRPDQSVSLRAIRQKYVQDLEIAIDLQQQMQD